MQLAMSGQRVSVACVHAQDWTEAVGAILFTAQQQKDNGVVGMKTEDARDFGNQTSWGRKLGRDRYGRAFRQVTEQLSVIRHVVALPRRSGRFPN